jgi:hypothetical protein
MVIKIPKIPSWINISTVKISSETPKVLSSSQYTFVSVEDFKYLFKRNASKVQ